jgi:hypothetical protein
MLSLRCVYFFIRRSEGSNSTKLLRDSLSDNVNRRHLHGGSFTHVMAIFFGLVMRCYFGSMILGMQGVLVQTLTISEQTHSCLLRHSARFQLSRPFPNESWSKGKRAMGITTLEPT